MIDRPPADPAGQVRLSDTDRDRAVSRLQAAAAERRITAPEFDGRVERALRARVAADLIPLLGDLPAESAEPADDDARVPLNAEGLPLLGGVPGRPRTSLAVLGVQRHNGRWVVPPRFTAVAILGSVVLDLRLARLAERETVVRSYGLLGVLRVIVPEGVEVRTGDDEAVAGDPRRPAAGPLVRITGLGLGGFTSVVVDSTVPRPRRRGFRWWVIRIRIP